MYRPHIYVIRDYKCFNSRVNASLTLLFYVCAPHEPNPYVVRLGKIGSKSQRGSKDLTVSSPITQDTESHGSLTLLKCPRTWSHVLVVYCALTSETHHVINKDVLLALGNEGIVIKLDHGTLVDEKELVQCLASGEIGDACLAVLRTNLACPKSSSAWRTSCCWLTGLRLLRKPLKNSVKFLRQTWKPSSRISLMNVDLNKLGRIMYLMSRNLRL